MEAHGNKSESEESVTATSLTKAWGEDKQPTYKLLQLLSAKGAKEFYLNHKPTFKELHEFLAIRRQQIAQILDQEPKHLLGVPRAGVDSATTSIDTQGRYKDFFPRLMSFYNTMKELPSGNIELTSSPPMLIYINYCLGLGTIAKVLGGDSLFIRHGGTPCSGICSFTGMVKADMTTKDYLIIEHTSPNHIDKIIGKAEEIYKKLDNRNLRDEEKVELIKEIGWYFSHAMPYKRGSAAICEMLIQALLNAHGLEFSYKQTTKSGEHPGIPLPLDLVAIFTPTPEQFSQSVTLINLNHREYKDLFDDIIKELHRHLPSADQHSSLFSNSVSHLEKGLTEKLIKLFSGDITMINFSEEESEVLKTSKGLNHIINKYESHGILPMRFIENVLGQVSMENMTKKY